MRHIKRLFLLLGLLAGLLLPASAWAATEVPDACTTPGVQDSTFCRDAARGQSRTDNTLVGPNGIITKGTKFMSWIAGVVAVAMIIIAGIKYASSSGDSNNISSAKNTLIFALVGLAIAASAQAIVIFVLSRLPG
jgi:hypothetical protein